jgi:transcriptional regulator with XRE-family HTH domain
MPKLSQPVTGSERIATRTEITRALDQGEIELGEAIRRRRLEWTGLNQTRFGKIVGLSANTISAIERDADSATLKNLKRILRRFGMRLTLRHQSMLTELSDQPE